MDDFTVRQVHSKGRNGKLRGVRQREIRLSISVRDHQYGKRFRGEIFDQRYRGVETGEIGKSTVRGQEVKPSLDEFLSRVGTVKRLEMFEKRRGYERRVTF